MATVDVNHEKKTIFDFYWWFNKFLNKDNESTDATFLPIRHGFSTNTNKKSGTDYRTYNLKGNEIRFHIKTEDISYLDYINIYRINSDYSTFNDNDIRNRLQYFDGTVRVFDKDVGFKDITYRLFIQYLNNGDYTYPAKNRVEMTIKTDNNRTEFYDYSEFGGKEEATQHWLNGGEFPKGGFNKKWNNMQYLKNNPNVNCLIIFDEPILQGQNTILKIGYDYEFVRDPFSEIVTQE